MRVMHSWNLNSVEKVMVCERNWRTDRANNTELPPTGEALIKWLLNCKLFSSGKLVKKMEMLSVGIICIPYTVYKRFHSQTLNVGIVMNDCMVLKYANFDIFFHPYHGNSSHHACLSCVSPVPGSGFVNHSWEHSLSCSPLISTSRSI